MGGIIHTEREAIVNIINYGNEIVTLYKNTNMGSRESYYDKTADALERVARVCESVQKPTVQNHLQDLNKQSSEHLNESEKHGRMELLDKYQDIFSKSPDDFGKTNLVQHCINTQDAAPIRQPSPRLPTGKRELEKRG